VQANFAFTGHVRGFTHTFGDDAQSGGFGVWWLFPPNPALAGNACRWAADLLLKFCTPIKKKFR
jgi:hypothetical protein